ncbi:MAG: PHP domain-containing protein [Myxococcales bacterium]|nr:PHP domain-containing protein [Myxococcales bacterium]
MPRAPARARYAIDLHMHSNWSDGTLTPAALVAAAARRGVRTIALTDHDTTAGVAEARAAGSARGVSIIAGIEISAWLDREIHVLGYFVDPDDPALTAATRRQSEARVRRVEAICERLAALGVVLDPAPIIASAHGNVGRPHIARALVAAGHVATTSEAFDRYIGNGGPAAVVVERLPAEDAIALIHAAGGVAVLAHPGVEQLEEHIPALAAAGLDGLEVDHPAHGRNVADRLRTLASKNRLVPTGGSDFHRPEGAIAIGHYGVTAAGLAALLDRRPAAA